MARGPCVLTESQIFSHLARPNSANEHFIMTVVFLNFSNGEKTRSWPHLPRFAVTLLLRPSYGAFLSYGFPTKLRAGPEGSYHKLLFRA